MSESFFARLKYARQYFQIVLPFPISHHHRGLIFYLFFLLPFIDVLEIKQ